MRVAVVSQPLDGVLPPEQNSVGIWTYEISRRISDRCAVTVFAKRTRHLRDTGIGRRHVDGAVDYRLVFAAPLRVWDRITRLLPAVAMRRHPIYVSRMYFVEYALRVAWLLRRERLDVVHLHNFIGFIPILRLFNRRSRIVLHMSCEWLSQIDADVIRKRVRHVDKILGTSDHITDLIKLRFPEYADRCHTVYNGVDPAIFEATSSARAIVGNSDEFDRGEPSPPAVLFVGRVSPEKGLHDLIDAMAIVFETHPDARLDIVGSIGALDPNFIVLVSDDAEVRALERFYASDGEEQGDYLAALRKRVPAGRENQVVFHGAVPYAAVIDHYRRTDVLVNPSYSESFGMTPVEAMACAVPVVATLVGGMKETIVDGVTGLSVERGDVEGLALAIDTIVSDPELRASMGRAGRERVIETFSWDSVADTVVSIYQSLMTDEQRPSKDRQ